MDLDFRTRDRKRFTGADVKRHPEPAPGINVQFEGGKGFHFGIRRDARLSAVTVELTAHKIFWIERRDRLQHLDLFIANRFAVGANGGFHRDISHHLKKMILHYVADGADLFVESAPALDSEIFGHGYLHAFDMRAIPKRLEHRIAKTEEQHAMHRLLAEVMVYAEDVLFIERLQQYLIERAGG